MSNLLTSELDTLTGESLESGFLPSKLQRWHADIKNLTASATQTAQSFVKVRFVLFHMSILFSHCCIGYHWVPLREDYSLAQLLLLFW